jgi:phospholipid transport system substrate-binding protein
MARRKAERIYAALRNRFSRGDRQVSNCSRVLVFACLCFVVNASYTQAAEPAALAQARAVVDGLHSALSANLVDGERRGFDARIARLAPVLAASFDFQTIARVALGRNIESLDSVARARFEHLLEELSTATYADRFSADGTQIQFEFISQQTARGDRILVRTRLQRPGESAVALDYVLQDSGRGFRIVNVLAEGVSDLSLKRAQYAAVIRSNGIAALLERVEHQLRDLLQSARAG